MSWVSLAVVCVGWLRWWLVGAHPCGSALFRYLQVPRKASLCCGTCRLVPDSLIAGPRPRCSPIPSQWPDAFQLILLNNCENNTPLYSSWLLFFSISLRPSYLVPTNTTRNHAIRCHSPFAYLVPRLSRHLSKSYQLRSEPSPHRAVTPPPNTTPLHTTRQKQSG